MRAAGRADLHEGELAAVQRILFEEAFEAQEAFRQTLGVIHAIHADAHHGRAQLMAPSSAARSA
jgi:hypothetical protein